MRPHDDLQQKLHQLDADVLRRRLHALPEVGGALEIDGRRVLNFSSNDYLNLANDPRLKRASHEAVECFGCGATSSRLMAGHLALHEALESQLASLTRYEAALVFPSGYQANVGAISTLAGEGDSIFSDELNHASLVDGCRLSRAEVHVYRHADMAHLAESLRDCTAPGRKLILTDAVFSMDGDLAPLVELSALAERHDAFLFVDEAHALGIYGNGAGLCAELGVQPDALSANLAKSLGGGGGFIAGSTDVVDLLVNRARSFIFSTGLAPGCVGAGLEAARIVMTEPQLGAELLDRAAFLRSELRRAGLDVPDHRSPIIPIIVGSNETALALSDALFERSILDTAIRPPSVPYGTSRLRFSVTLAHSRDELVRAAAVIADVVQSARART
jgi:8-amino-7-oxononanoate synthase